MRKSWLADVYPSRVSPSATELGFVGLYLMVPMGPRCGSRCGTRSRNVSWKHSRWFDGKQDIPRETGPEAWICMKMGSKNSPRRRLIYWFTQSIIAIFGKVVRVSSVNESHKPSWLTATHLHHSSCTVGCWHSEMQGLERCQFANEDGFLRSCQVPVGTHSDGEPHQKPKYG